MSKVLVTGGSGFLGGRLVRALVQEGHTVVYTYRSRPLNGVRATGLKLDLSASDQLVGHTGVLEGVTHLVHAAASVDHSRADILQDLHDQITVPVEGFGRLIRLLSQLERVVYVSSGSAALFDTDPTFYGLGKLLMEGVVSRVGSARNIPVVALRFPQLYGPGEPHGIFVTKFLEALLSGESIQLVNEGVVQKDILYIDDAVGAVLQALRAAVESGVYTITMEKASTVKEVLHELALATHTVPHVHPVQVSEEAVRAKSFHLASTAAKLGYKLQYDLRDGIVAFVRDAEERRYV